MMFQYILQNLQSKLNTNDSISTENYSNIKNKYHNSFWTLDSNSFDEIRKNYKIIDIDWLDQCLVKYKMCGDKYFESNINKKQIVNEMINFHLTHKDKKIYEKTDYLCNEQEKICICNTNANDLRKIYDGQNYIPNEKFISLISLIENYDK